MNGSHGKRMVREDWIRKPRHCHLVNISPETDIEYSMLVYTDSTDLIDSTAIKRFLINFGGTFYYPVTQVYNKNTGSTYKQYTAIKLESAICKEVCQSINIPSASFTIIETSVLSNFNIVSQKLIY